MQSIFFPTFALQFKNRLTNNQTILARIRIFKYALLAATLVLTMTGCQYRSHTAMHSFTAEEDSLFLSLTDTTNTEMTAEIQRGVILERVQDIYRLIRSEYMAHGGSYENELFDRTFCSKSWNKLMMAVRWKEDQTGTLFFEINHWSMTRYSGNMLAFEEFELKHLNLHSKVKRAVVSFTAYEDYTYTPARVELVYEDNQWKIDNFYNMKYRLNVRTAMWNYIHNPHLI